MTRPSGPRKGPLSDSPLPSNRPRTIASWKFFFYVGDIQGTPLSDVVFQSPRALILGNEGQGASPWAESLGAKIHIPMREEAESLNVAAAGAIMLYAMRPL